jgi:hypothetical protein
MTARTTRPAPRSGAGVAVGAVGELDHVNATIIPFRVRGTPARRSPHIRHPRPAEKRTADLDDSSGAAPIAQIIPRQQAKVAGRVRSIQFQPWSGMPALKLTIIANARDGLAVVFSGRRRIAGVHFFVPSTVGPRLTLRCTSDTIFFNTRVPAGQVRYLPGDKVV